jgi:hypothetical protein
MAMPPIAQITSVEVLCYAMLPSRLSFWLVACFGTLSFVGIEVVDQVHPALR